RSGFEKPTSRPESSLARPPRSPRSCARPNAAFGCWSRRGEVLRRAAAYLSQANLPGKGGTRTRASSPLTASPSRWRGRVLGIARQPYYRWLKNPVTDAELAEAYRANALFDAHREDPEFGYRYLADEAETAGEKMCRRTAWRICSTG